MGLMCSAHPHDNPDCAEEHHYIREQGPIADVSRFERNDLFEVGNLIPPGHLPRSRNPGLHIEARLVMRLVQLDF